MVVTSLLLLFAQTNCNLLGGLAGSTPGTYRPPHSSQSASVKAQVTLSFSELCDGLYC
jgi:hypothetical protein